MLRNIKREKKLNSKDTNFLAFIYARHNEKEKAITTWCRTLEKKKNDRIAKNALDYLRQKGRDINLMDDEHFDSIHPKIPFLIPFGLILKFLL